ncbi:ubiquitin-conjugating enzyme family protein [Zymoseptoria brevis]|uniref:Ubiquitin-conjugating enzyme family protein n=1 Tax=Zymoseptoria brevis TaxID=1047168 RepID=A0A0F4H225_9PEZI|nr:ubiquitin-conjugating enzyme family protein [Zymoseptoria brevis]
MTNRATTTGTAALLHQRLRQDIKEIVSKPYPGIDLRIQDSNALTTACLILTPEGEDALHLTIEFGPDYPLKPPNVTIQSRTFHPNVFQDYICINILKTDVDGLYTPAYTLKGICIQLLSFFASDTIEQIDYGGIQDLVVDRRQWQDEEAKYRSPKACAFHCMECGFGTERAMLAGKIDATNDAPARWREGLRAHAERISHHSATSSGALPIQPTNNQTQWRKLEDLPNDLLLDICDFLGEEDLFIAARAWNGFSNLIRDYDTIRNRELHCFTLRGGLHHLDLGVGVHVKYKAIQSEFDLLSRQAFDECHSFMNEVVVRLSGEAQKYDGEEESDRLYGIVRPKSSLKHASEKAMESYFHLFHLLLCVSIERPNVARDAQSMVENFIAYRRTKVDCPNLGYLLIAILISDIEVTEDFSKAIIREAVTRNVVWMLDGRGSNLPDLSFMETSNISEYRLQKTFEAGLTSYRLLMFLNLMRKVVRSVRTKKDPNTGESKTMSLVELRDHLFASRGAPPYGTATKLAAEVRKIQQVSSFPQFLANMGLASPPASVFTQFLRDTVHDSMKHGYSRWAISQEVALWARLQQEPNVERPERMAPQFMGGRMPTFFPNQPGGRRGRGR